jgi:hypothetical protein
VDRAKTHPSRVTTNHPRAIRSTVHCGEGARGPVACWLRCYASRRDWSFGDLMQVVGRAGEAYLTDVWYGDTRQHTYEWIEELKSRLRDTAGKSLERHHDKPLQGWEADALDAAVKAEATTLKWWEEEAAQLAQVSATPGGGLGRASRATRAIRARAHHVGRKIWTLWGRAEDSAGEGGFEPPIG